jgi:methyl-accepting chemotaxis protein
MSVFAGYYARIQSTGFSDMVSNHSMMFNLLQSGAGSAVERSVDTAAGLGEQQGDIRLVEDEVAIDAASSDLSVFECSNSSVLASFLLGVDDPAYIIDREGTVTHTNEACREFYGNDELGDAVGANVFDFEESHKEVLKRVLDEGVTVQNREEELAGADGSTPVSRTIWPLYDEEKRIVGAFEMFRDISERRELERREQALEAYQEEAIDVIQHGLDRLSDGDLTITPEVPDPQEEFEAIESVHERFETMAQDLTRAIEQFRTALQDIDATTSELRQISEDLSAASTEATAVVERIEDATASTTEVATEQAEISRRAEENVSNLSASIQEVTSNTQQIQQRAQESLETIETGSAEAMRALERIDGAVDASRQNVQVMERVSDRMARVTERTQLIDDIAEQTNILALNANIEAARADVDGESFGVVADEVQALATESRTTVDDIETTVEGLRESVGEAMERIDESNDKVTDGASAVEELADRIEELERLTTETTHSLEEIAEATERQASNADEVHQIVTETAELSETVTARMDDISSEIETHSETVQSVDSTAAAVADSAAAMTQQLSFFTLDGESVAASGAD